ncbi:hypothetical protein FB446DRAFT_741653 [Lentinula raphanica]|nr:hypothetical protein FB446DRAFT_741653 [Lentinula raphanica]
MKGARLSLVLALRKVILCSAVSYHCPELTPAKLSIPVNHLKLSQAVRQGIAELILVASSGRLFRIIIPEQGKPIDSKEL